MKLIVSILLSLCSIVSTFGQGSDATWSREYKIEGYQRIVGQQNGNLYLQRSLRGHFETSFYNSELAKYDPTGEVTHIISVEKLERQKYQELYAIDTDLGIAVIYLTTDPKSDKHWLISAQLYSHEDLSPMQIVDLMKIRSRRAYAPQIGDYVEATSLIDIDFKLSDDRNKLAIIYSEERIGKDKYTVFEGAIVDLQNGLNIINTGIVETEKRSDKYSYEDVAFDSQGNFIIVLKSYEDDREFEFVGKRPGYKYSVYYQGVDSLDYIYDVPMKGWFIDGMVAAMDEDGNTYLTGLIRKRPYNNVYGTAFAKISRGGELLYFTEKNYSKREIKKVRGKEKSDIEEEYQVIDLKVANGIAYAVFQYSIEQRETDNAAFNNRRFSPFGNLNRNRFIYFQQKRNVLVHGFDKSNGDRLWSSVNQRRQSDYDDFEYFTYGNISLYNDRLFLLYNESLNNLSRIRADKRPSDINLPERKTLVTKVEIDQDGNMIDELLSEESYNYIVNEGTLFHNGNLFMLALGRNYNRFKIGHKAFK